MNETPLGLWFFCLLPLSRSACYFTEVRKKKTSENCFCGMERWKVWVGYPTSKRKSEQKKKKNQTHARLKTGCTDRESRETSIPPSPRAPRPRERERIGVLSLGFMDIRASGGSGGKGKNKTHQPENGKLKEKREIGNPPKPKK